MKRARMSPYGTSRTSGDVRLESAKWAKADIDEVAVTKMQTSGSAGQGTVVASRR
jgi:hypothetical protein